MNLHPALVDAGVLDRCEPLDVSKKKNEPEWLAARSLGLGSSDAGAALGLSPYTSPMELWLEKTGQIPSRNLDVDDPDNEAVYWGLELEDVVARGFARRTGWEVIDPGCMFVDRARPQLRTNPDRFFIDSQGRLGVLEVKTADSHLYDDWSDGSSPPWYQAQLAQQCGVLGIPYGYLVVLIGGNRMKIVQVQLTEAYLARFMDILADWWEHHVVQGHAPTIDGTQSTAEALNRLWKSTEDQVELGAEGARWLRAYHDAHKRLKQAEEDKMLAGNHLRSSLEQHAIGTINGQPVVTWREVQTDRFDQTAHSFDAPDCHNTYRKVSTVRSLKPGRSKAAIAAIAKGNH